MKCLFPVRYYRSRDSKGNTIVHHSPNGVNVFSSGYRPCQMCINCRLTRANAWAIRMSHEASLHSQSCFLTLTYDPSKVPANGSLQYNDVRKFIKKLRRRLHRCTSLSSPLSFFYVGEYGSDFSRPHYHMVLFGFDFTDPIKYKGVINDWKFSSQDKRYYKSTFATDCWSNGFVDVGRVDYDTAMYVAKYVTKSERASVYESALLAPEKSSKSTKVPIATNWISKYWRDVYPCDYVLLNGVKHRPPRMYDEWLKKNQPEVYEAVKTSREENSVESFDPHQLYNSHFIRIQKQKSFLRDGCAPNLRNDSAMLERKFDIINSLSKGIL